MERVVVENRGWLLNASTSLSVAAMFVWIFVGGNAEVEINSEILDTVARIVLVPLLGIMAIICSWFETMAKSRQHKKYWSLCAIISIMLVVSATPLVLDGVNDAVYIGV